MQQSFIDVAPDSHFPLQNLPYGVFSTRDIPDRRVGVAIGEYVLDIAFLAERGFFRETHPDALALFQQPTLNAFMAAGAPLWSAVRARLTLILSAENPELRDDDEARSRALYAQREVALHLPVDIGDYTDFYSSKEHATNVGIMFRGKENALMPNYLHLPVGYHGRASSVVLSGTDICRPQGQSMPAGATAPVFGPSRLLDFELEMGHFIGVGNPLGAPVAVADALSHAFGMVLVNDWSARDIQAWEYQPLGPFLAKNFATSISPWVVTMEALAPFRVKPPQQEPEPLPYLRHEDDVTYDIHLEVELQSAAMDAPFTICRSNFRHLYWSIAQQIAHHTITGCNLCTGDLLASGTISGATPESYGSLLELTWRGARPLTLPNGETRRFLEDGDTLSMSGYCQGDGFRVGFGSVTGTILPAREPG